MEAVRPCVLEVEAARDAIDIDNFSREIEALHQLALHRLEINLVESNTTARDEFVLIRTFAGDCECRGCELAEKLDCLRLTELRPRRSA